MSLNLFIWGPLKLRLTRETAREPSINASLTVLLAKILCDTFSNKSSFLNKTIILESSPWEVLGFYCDLLPVDRRLTFFTNILLGLALESRALIG